MRLLSLLLVLASASAVQAQYKCTTNDDAITITEYTGPGGAVVIPNWLSAKPVVRIGNNVFKDRINLTSVSMGTNLASIGDSAFYGCTGLTNVTIGANVTNIEGSAFFACLTLPYIAIPDSVKSIGELAFYNCPALADITIGTNVSTIGLAAFYYCTGLTSVTIPNGVTRIAPSLFYNCTSLTNVTIPAGVTSIGYQAFCNCTSLDNVKIPDSVTRIERLAFDFCTSLTSIVIPEGVTLLDECVLYMCTSLTNVVIPDGVTNIAYAAFWSCTSLTNVTIPEAVTNIGQMAFSASGLTGVTIPDSVRSIGDQAFYACPDLTTIIVGSGVAKLGTWPFARCPSLVSFAVDADNSFYCSIDGLLFNKSGTVLLQCPGAKAGSYTTSTNVTRIADNAFDSCSSLTNVTISGSVTNIGSGAFYSCTSLARVMIGAGVSNLGSYAFYDCTSLTGVFFPGNAPGLGSSAFYNATNATVYYVLGTKGWGPTYGGRPAVLYTVFNVLPPRTIGKNSFTARWICGEGGAPEGQLCVASNSAFTQFVPGYEARYVVNNTDCAVTNLAAGRDYWYRVRRLFPDGSASPWSASMKVRTGKGMPVFKNLLSEGPVSKGPTQAFVISDMISGGGTLKVKSSNENAVKAGLTTGALTLQYLWKDSNTAAKVTLTLTHPDTGYKAAYDVSVSRSTGSVAIVNQTALTNAGTVAAQELTLDNRTGEIIYGARLRVQGLEQPAWLINQTGLDPIGGAAIREMPCVWPAGSQMVVRLVYNVAYKKQARTRPATVGAWAILTPVNGAPPVNGELTITRQNPFDGLWLLGMPANRNRLYAVYHSDDDGESWIPEQPLVRATANYLMWLDVDEEAPSNRIYRVVE